MPHLWFVVRHAVPWLSLESLLVIDALLLTGGALGTSETAARQLGLLNRFRLARILKQDGLPPLHRLSGWIRVLHWVDEWERSKVSPCRSALTGGMDPAACYRLVRKVTGVRWTDVRSSGVRWALVRFLKECRRPDARVTAKASQAAARR
jgi:hypothetical protein